METVTNDKLARDVLIIDDNADLTQSLRELLQFYGCRVETAADGFKLHKGAVGQPIERAALLQNVIKLCSK